MSDEDVQPIFLDDISPSLQNRPLDAAAKNSRRKSIAITRRSLGNNILEYVDDDNHNELPVHKSKGSKLFGFRRKIRQELNQIPKELRQDHLAKAIHKAGFKLRDANLEELLQSEISDEYFKCLYVIASYTISNYFGKPSAASDGPQKLLIFLNQVIPLNPKDREKCIRISKKIDPPSYVISLKIIEAKDLIALDANGLSDPFCKVWLKCHKQHVKLTEIKKGTVNPEWNEAFHFNVTNVKEDVICIHIWDDDPTGLAANLKDLQHVKSLRGCFNFCRDCMENTCPCGKDTVDDFIGKTEIEIGSVYSEGEDKWLTLTDESGRPRQGELHIAIKFDVHRPKNTLDALKRHFLLAKVCLEHGLKLNEVSEINVTSWEHILSLSAQTLLFQHSVQGNIYTFEDFVCKFVNVVHLAMQHICFDFQFLYNILTETHESMVISADYLVDNPLQDIYRQAVESLEAICQHVLGDLHSFDIIENESQRIQLEFVLRCVKLCQGIVGKTSDLESTLKAEAEAWAVVQGEELNSITSDQRVDALTTFLRFLVEYQKAADRVFGAVFPENTYTYITYESLDNILYEPIKAHVVQIAEESLHAENDDKVEKRNAALKVCISLDTTTNYISEAVNIPCSELQLGQFLNWFGTDTIKEWFKWKEEVIILNIEVIVINDDFQSKLMMCGDRYELHSDSAVGTADLIKNELFRLWKLVSNQDQPEFNHLFLWGLHNCCMKYAEFLLGLIPMQDLGGSFKTGGKRKICAVANNLWSMSEFSSKLIRYVRVDLDGDGDLPYTKHSLQLTCRILCRDLGYLIRPDLAQKMWQVVQSASRKEQERNLRGFVSYMRKLIKVEGSSDMAFEVRLLFISEVWSQVVELAIRLKEMQNDPGNDYESCAERLRRCLGRNANVYYGLLAVLKETEKFCYLDREGKLKKFMWNDEYNCLKSDLEQLILLG